MKDQDLSRCNRRCNGIYGTVIPIPDDVSQTTSWVCKFETNRLVSLDGWAEKDYICWLKSYLPAMAAIAMRKKVVSISFFFFNYCNSFHLLDWINCSFMYWLHWESEKKDPARWAKTQNHSTRWSTGMLSYICILRYEKNICSSWF